MGIQFDLIIPPVIVGFIILALFSINTFMMETSVENRLSHEMQTFADNTVILLQDELRTLDSIESLTDSTISFATTKKDTIKIYRQGRNLNITRTDAATATTDTEEYPARLQSLKFTRKNADNEEALNNANTAIIHFRAVTQSTPDQQVGEESKRIRAYAEKQVYLRNKFYK